MTTYHVHFGVIPTAPDYAAEILHPELGYVSALAGSQGFQMGDRRVFIDGSWVEWGPDGYEDETSLHVVVEFDHNPSSQEILHARYGLSARLFRESRLVDYAVVTTKDDWADVRSVATFTSWPEVVTFKVDNRDRGYAREGIE